MKYLVHVSKLYSDSDTYRFTTKEKRDAFIKKIPNGTQYNLDMEDDSHAK